MFGARNPVDKRSISGQLLADWSGGFSANETFLAFTQEAAENVSAGNFVCVCVRVRACVRERERRAVARIVELCAKSPEFDTVVRRVCRIAKSDC